MNAVLGAIASAFSWTFPAPNSAVALVLGAILGQVFRLLFSLPGKPARERKQTEQMKTAVKEGIREYEDWKSQHPGEPMTDSVREQIAVASATTVIETFTGIAIHDKPKFWVSVNPPEDKTSGGI